MFNIYDTYYKMGLFTEADINLFVTVGDLTQTEADKILKREPAQAQLIGTYSRHRNTQYIDKPHSDERGFYYGRLLERRVIELEENGLSAKG